MDDGFVYVFQKRLANDVTNWEIVKRGKCKTRVKFDENEDFLEMVNEHTHAPSREYIEVHAVRALTRRQKLH